MNDVAKREPVGVYIVILQYVWYISNLRSKRKCPQHPIGVLGSPQVVASRAKIGGEWTYAKKPGRSKKEVAAARHSNFWSDIHWSGAQIEAWDR